jgi:hypothetical protein
MKKECNWCKRKVDKLYEHKRYMICWDCYWEDVDKEKYGNT